MSRGSEAWLEADAEEWVVGSACDEQVDDGPVPLDRLVLEVDKYAEPEDSLAGVPSVTLPLVDVNWGDTISEP